MDRLVDRMEFELTDLTFTFTLFGMEGWTRQFAFEVFHPDNITTSYDLQDKEPFLECPISGITKTGGV